MAEIKTKPTTVSPAEFVKNIADEQQRKDCGELVTMMKSITGKPAKMWGNIVGFDEYHYKYDSGREGDMLLTGFAPRKGNITLYLGPGIADKALVARLGKCKTGKGCLYIKKLGDVDRNALRELVSKSVDEMRKRYSRS
jgi:hypothetical protein